MKGALYHLWGQVVQGPAHGAPPAVGGVHRPPEVGDLDVPLGVQQQILRLNVSVDHLIRQCEI